MNVLNCNVWVDYNLVICECLAVVSFDERRVVSVMHALDASNEMRLGEVVGGWWL